MRRTTRGPALGGVSRLHSVKVLLRGDSTIVPYGGIWAVGGAVSRERVWRGLLERTGSTLETASLPADDSCTDGGERQEMGGRERGTDRRRCSYRRRTWRMTGGGGRVGMYATAEA